MKHMKHGLKQLKTFGASRKGETAVDAQPVPGGGGYTEARQ
jgi:hypothetical protein